MLLCAVAVLQGEDLSTAVAYLYDEVINTRIEVGELAVTANTQRELRCNLGWRIYDLENTTWQQQTRLQQLEAWAATVPQQHEARANALRDEFQRATSGLEKMAQGYMQRALDAVKKKLKPLRTALEFNWVAIKNLEHTEGGWATVKPRGMSAASNVEWDSGAMPAGGVVVVGIIKSVGVSNHGETRCDTP